MRLKVLETLESSKTKTAYLKKRQALVMEPGLRLRCIAYTIAVTYFLWQRAFWVGVSGRVNPSKYTRSLPLKM